MAVVASLHELGQLPDLVLGDYDSLAPSAQEYFTGQGVRLLTAEQDQDQTDLEIGLELAAEQALAELLGLWGLGKSSIIRWLIYL